MVATCVLLMGASFNLPVLLIMHTVTHPWQGRATMAYRVSTAYSKHTRFLYPYPRRLIPRWEQQKYSSRLGASRSARPYCGSSAAAKADNGQHQHAP